jgi:hypothetical protein
MHATARSKEPAFRRESAHTVSAAPMPPICWIPAPICAPFNCCWATRTSSRPSSTCTFSSAIYTRPPIRSTPSLSRISPMSGLHGGKQNESATFRWPTSCARRVKGSLSEDELLGERQLAGYLGTFRERFGPDQLANIDVNRTPRPSAQPKQQRKPCPVDIARQAKHPRANSREPVKTLVYRPDGQLITRCAGTSCSLLQQTIFRKNNTSRSHPAAAQPRAKGRPSGGVSNRLDGGPFY